MKTDMFFELLRAIYGAARFESQWPDEKHLAAGKRMWEKKIESHTKEELGEALRHAQKMMCSDERGWDWPNIGLILSGVKKGAMHQPHPALSAPEETEEQKASRIANGIKQLDKIRAML